MNSPTLNAREASSVFAFFINPRVEVLRVEAPRSSPFYCSACIYKTQVAFRGPIIKSGPFLATPTSDGHALARTPLPRFSARSWAIILGRPLRPFNAAAGTGAGHHYKKTSIKISLF